MSSFFKKALGVFVEFEETPAAADTAISPQFVAPQNNSTLAGAPAQVPNRVETKREDVDKFEKHFSSLLEEANQPGPDYYEFFKMMETLEAHIPDERARMAAVFASLSIQGMTKEMLLKSAATYGELIARDDAQFHSALDQKTHKEVEERQQSIKELEDTIQQNAEKIQQLTREITEYQAKIAVLKKEAGQEQHRIEVNSSAYRIASQAISAKIQSDIQKIQSYL